MLLFPNSRLVLCQIFSYDFPKIRNLHKIFLRSFDNVSPGSSVTMTHTPAAVQTHHLRSKPGLHNDSIIDISLLRVTTWCARLLRSSNTMTAHRGWPGWVHLHSSQMQCSAAIQTTTTEFTDYVHFISNSIHTLLEKFHTHWSKQSRVTADRKGNVFMRRSVKSQEYLSTILPMMCVSGPSLRLTSKKSRMRMTKMVMTRQ